MNPIHREALAAAARIACLTLVAGCGPKTAPEATVDGSAAPTPPDTTPTEVTDVEPAQSEESPAGEQDCNALMTKASKNTEQGGKEASKSVQECCTAEITRAEADAADKGTWPESEFRDFCCFQASTDMPMRGMCTPWGPPCPPSHPAERVA